MKTETQSGKSPLGRPWVILAILLGFSVSSTGGKELALVQDGKANCVIVVPPESNSLQKSAVEDFTRTIRRASGADIPVIGEAEAQRLAAGIVRIVLGPGPLAEALGCKGDDLKPEEFRLATIDNSIVVLARDLPGSSSRAARMWGESRVTTWALSHIMDRFLGVRWLWPGELGTVVPQRKTIRVPEINVRRQPELLGRRFRHRGNSDALLWSAHHQVMGGRQDYHFSHSFRAQGDNGDWWERFSESRPDYFARNPAGEIAYTNNNREMFHLCVSNPAVTEQIVRLWEEAGKPDFWDVTPNDGSGFCSCDNCRALDLKFGGVTYSREDIWRFAPHVSLTDRYVWHWNQLIRKMRENNPNVRIGVYFYSAYRNPPRTLKLEDGIVGEIVHGFDFSFWKNWQTVGAKEIGLRPNWWHMGANGPNLLLRRAGKYVEQARVSGMRMFVMDSLQEYWAAQGPYYYVMARLVSRPDLTTEDIISEYCEAFGKAAPEMRRYLEFWEEYHEKVAYNVPAGGALTQDPKGLYETVSRERFGSVMHPLAGHWKTIPYIYTAEVLAQGHAILDRARINANTEETRARIEFIRDGLNQVSKVAAFLNAPNEKKEEALKALAAFSESRAKQYGYWGNNGISVMRRRGVIGKEVPLSGL